MIYLNLAAFSELQGAMTEEEMADKLCISRVHLRAIKRRTSPVGQKFIVNFKKAYPGALFEKHFYIV